MNPSALSRIGWKQHFQSQMTLAEFETLKPLRIAEVQRSVLFAVGAEGRCTVHFPTHERWSEALTVGDWVLARTQGEQLYLVRVLERENALIRKAAGPAVAAQMLAANIDCVFILSTCSADFSRNRIERYLALALESRITPVIVLTRADEVDDPSLLLGLLPPEHAAVAIDARDAAQVAALARWLTAGSTTALLGSSGVGKSTLSNTLLGEQRQQTRAVREEDSRGRHTTTARHLLHLPQGAMLIDTPGMREVQLPDVDAALSTLFADVEALAQQCRFADCTHAGEPGCGVRAAIADGTLDAQRFGNYQKMQREQAFHGRELRDHWQLTAERRRFSRGVRAKVKLKDRIRHSGLADDAD